MGSKYASIDFPNELLEGMNVEGIIISPVDARVGIVALTGRYEGRHLLRLYQLREKGDEYYPTHELQAFTFPTKKDLKDFMNKLPKMSAIEILMYMNQMPGPHH